MTSTTKTPGAVAAAILGGGFMAATFDFFAAMLIYGGTASGVAKAIARGWYGAAVKTMPPIVDTIGRTSSCRKWSRLALLRCSSHCRTVDRLPASITSSHVRWRSGWETVLWPCLHTLERRKPVHQFLDVITAQ